MLEKNLRTGRDCAIKLIVKSNGSPSVRRYMKRQVQIMHLVLHALCVALQDREASRYIQLACTTRIVMEDMGGGVLSEAVAERGGGDIQEDVACPTLAGILAGVEYLHKSGFVHRMSSLRMK